MIDKDDKKCLELEYWAPSRSTGNQQKENSKKARENMQKIMEKKISVVFK